MKLNPLNPEEEAVIVYKGTEAPYLGKFTDHKEEGTYVCKRCSAPLYNSHDKFDSGCGWPSFDDEIPGAISRVPDRDGHRIEILCGACGAHLGHIFEGERFTPKNVRHCVNSISLDFAPKEAPSQPTTKTALFAAGCFWGVEYYFQQTPGVLATRVGFAGGPLKNPSYREVCDGNTGHYEVIEVTYDPATISYEELLKLFFSIHDFSQENGQGPDIGPQYRSAIFYSEESQLQTAEKIIDLLRSKNHTVATILIPATPFYPADDKHQSYYLKNGHTPYCHTKRNIFEN